MPALRTNRLARLQAMMRQHDIPICLFFNPANIRYATGTDVMGVWTATTLARYCLIAAEGKPVLLNTERRCMFRRSWCATFGR